jgi:hypothetical protein
MYGRPCKKFGTPLSQKCFLSVIVVILYTNCNTHLSLFLGQSLHTTNFDYWDLLHVWVWHTIYRPSLPQLFGNAIQPTPIHHLLPDSDSVTTRQSALQYRWCRNGTTTKCFGNRLYATPIYMWWQCHDHIWYTKDIVQKKGPKHQKNSRATNTITLLIICRFPMVRVRKKNSTLPLVFFKKSKQ